MADKHIPFGTHPAPAMSNAQKVIDERAEALVNNLIDAVSWQATAETNGYAAGDPACERDADDVKNAKLALITELQSLRAAPTPDAHSEVGVKALEWKYRTTTAVAQTPFGEYEVAKFTETDGIVYSAMLGAFELGEFSADNEAYAAAQADFAQRVQSCLTAGVVKAEPNLSASILRLIGRGNAILGYCETREAMQAGATQAYVNWKREADASMELALSALASKPEGER